jgi:hypothetical protein
VTVEQVWGRAAIAELRDRLATADGPHDMLTLLEEEAMRRLPAGPMTGLTPTRTSKSFGGSPLPAMDFLPERQLTRAALTGRCWPPCIGHAAGTASMSV